MFYLTIKALVCTLLVLCLGGSTSFPFVKNSRFLAFLTVLCQGELPVGVLQKPHSFVPSPIYSTHVPLLWWFLPWYKTFSNLLPLCAAVLAVIFHKYRRIFVVTSHKMLGMAWFLHGPANSCRLSKVLYCSVLPPCAIAKPQTAFLSK